MSGSHHRRAAAAAWLERALLVFAAAVPLSIAAAQVALTASFAAWFLAGRPRPRSRLLVPAASYAALTLLSALASLDPLASLGDTKELLQLGVLVLVPAALDRAPALAGRLGLAWVLGCAASALWGLARYAASPGGLEFRSTGPFGHYMTFGGMMMLGAVAAFTGLVAPGASRPGARLALLVLLLAAVAASWARNTWLGLPLGLAVASLLLRPRVLGPLVIAGLLTFLALPDAMSERFASSFDPAANPDRLEMLRFGSRLMRENPWLGVGPDRVPVVWREHHPGEKPQPHLHNNFTQIATERGLPALGAWLWLLGATVVAAWPGARARPARLAAVTAVAATAALLLAGSFEYNFGDSEVKMAWLLLAALGAHSTRPRSEP